MNKINLISNQNNESNVRPKRGDVVIPLAGYEIGLHGIIENFYFERDKTKPTEISVGFNVRAFKEEGRFTHVSLSGGPFSDILPSQLTHIGTKSQAFWDFRNGAGANMGVDYEETVDVWVYEPNETGKLCLGHKFDSYSEYLDSQEIKKAEHAKINTQTKSITDEIEQGSLYVVKRGEYVVNDKSKWPNNDFRSEGKVQKIFEAHRRNRHLLISKHDKPIGCGYLYTGDGYAFRNKVEFDAFLSAYALKVSDIEGPWGQLMIVPNINVDEWQPLTLTTLPAIEKSA